MSNLQQTDSKQLLVFTLDEQSYALYLSVVERVVRAVEITRLPKAPEFILGVIDVQGQIIPVIDVCQRLQLPARELDVDDQFIIAHTSRRRVALVVDSVVDVGQIEDRELVNAEQVLPSEEYVHGREYIHGIAKLENGLVLICDLDQFLSIEE
ncbi:MAG: chemotaxis protein CheW, partial [Anaerolineaceae bacterium]|nr:chemotaxis protein CheW [Anaerolineaceae bacterium]